MARIIYSALVESISGSIKGTTFQKNAYGYTIKAKPNMVNPNTQEQRRRKSSFSQAMQAWRNLTDANRLAWDAYANTFPIPSRKNPSAYLSGFNAFARWHGLRFLGSHVVLPDPSGPQGTISVGTIELVIDGASLNILIDAVETEGPFLCFIFATRPLGNTVSFVKGWTRIITALDSTGWPDFDITTGYTLKFGNIPSVGDRIGVRLAFLNTTNGQVFFEPAQIVVVT